MGSGHLQNRACSAFYICENDPIWPALMLIDRFCIAMDGADKVRRQIEGCTTI